MQSVSVCICVCKKYAHPQRRVCMLQLLDDQQNVVPMPASVSSTLRLESFPGGALMSGWGLSSDRTKFLVKLKAHTGTATIRLMDNARHPLLHAAEGGPRDMQSDVVGQASFTEVARHLLAFRLSLSLAPTPPLPASLPANPLPASPLPGPPP